MEPIEGEGATETVEYEPVSVKDLLVEMKDTSELLIDLAYSAVLHNSETIAAEVVRLESRMDVLRMQARMSILMASRSPSDAEALAPVLGIVGGAEKISNAAGDIAKIVLEEIGLPDAMRAALPDAIESLVRGTVDDTSEYAGRSLVDINLETNTGVRVIAIRRGEDWIMNPGPDTMLEHGDSVLLRGPDATIGEVFETLTKESYEPPAEVEPAIADLERAVDSIIVMKNLSELAVDLAYGSVLFDNADLAEEVQNLEIEVDALQSRFEAWTLRAAKESADPVSLRGLIHLGISTEVISDAAVEISEGVLRDIDVHPVVELAVQESDEILIRVRIEPGSDLDGTALIEGVPDEELGLNVLAIRRPGEGWTLTPDVDTVLHGSDVLIAKGTRSSGEQFTALAQG